MAGTKGDAIVAPAQPRLAFLEGLNDDVFQVGSYPPKRACYALEWDQSTATKRARLRGYDGCKGTLRETHHPRSGAAIWGATKAVVATLVVALQDGMRLAKVRQLHAVAACPFTYDTEHCPRDIQLRTGIHALADARPDCLANLAVVLQHSVGQNLIPTARAGLAPMAKRDRDATGDP